MEGFNYKYYEHEAGNAWVNFDECSEHNPDTKSLLSMLDTIGRSLACIADALERREGIAGPKTADWDVGIAEEDDEE